MKMFGDFMATCQRQKVAQHKKKALVPPLNNKFFTFLTMIKRQIDL